jgi:ABC-type multidrug transport system fused ATPase/permease subunit
MIFRPIYDILRYLKIYQFFLGARMYLIYALSSIASFFEGIGILMLLPLLQSLEGPVNENEINGGVNEILYKLIDALGLSNSVTSILFLISVAFILKAIITFFALGYNAFLIGKLLKEIKIKLFNLYSKMSLNYYSSKNTGDLINIINEQPTKSVEAFKQLTLLGSHLINTIILMAIAFSMTLSFGIMALILGIFLLILFLKMNAYVQNLSRIAAKENGILNKWLIQTLHGFKYLISTSQIRKLEEYISNSISILTSTTIKSGVAGAFTQSVREPIAVVFIMIIVYVQLFVFGLRLEPILVSIALFYRALNSTLAVQSAFQGTFQHIGSMELVYNEFQSQEKNQIIEGKKVIKNFHTEILLDNISFRYSNSAKNTLEKISLKIPNKTSIAIVGESGSGKTTLVDIISLINKPSSGSLRIDGVDSLDINGNKWRENIGYVSQDTIIFDDTIANNISMWNTNPEANNDKQKLAIINAAKQANIFEFIQTLPQGINTRVGDRGILLSGGQKQRLFIARELYRRPKVLILDEATSSLDSESEKYIQNSIESLHGQITLIIIAHRLSTIKNVDIIHLIDNGKLIVSGTYDQLIKNESKFKRLVDLQKL